MAANVESMAYNGAVPWHGLGVPVKENLTPAEILVAASLNWSVRREGIVTSVSGQTMLDHYALVRDVDNQILGICGKEYQPFQNSEVFDFFTKFVEAGKMEMHIAGSLLNGKYIWALAKIKDGQFNLMGDDPNYSYLLMVSPHVWGKAMTLLFTSVRVVCWNTMNMALSRIIAERFRILHNRTFPELKAAAQDTIEQVLVVKEKYAQQALLLAQAKAEKDQALEYFARLVSPKALDSFSKISDLNELNDNARRIIYNFEKGPGAELVSAKGTWWGAFNAVTRFVDHQQGRSGQDKRLYDSWLGIKSKLKHQALDLAIEYAEAA